MDKELALLHKKIDHLTEQFEIQHQRQAEINELFQDAIPLVNHMVKLSINELAEVGNDFELGDLLFLLKRLLRDTHLLVGLLDQVETVAELADEGQKIGKRIFHQVTMELDRLERTGYFDFARAGGRLAERMVNDFKAEDLETTGNRILSTLKTEPPQSVSLPMLVREFNNPAVRRGLFRTLNLLKAIGD